MTSDLIKITQMTEQQFEQFNIAITTPLQPSDQQLNTQ